MVFLFDVDGVINKSEYFTAQYVKDFGVDISVFRNFFRNDFSQCLIGQKDVRDVIKLYFQQRKWEKTADDFLQYWFEKDVKLDLQLLDYLQEIKKQGYYCGLASQQESHRKKHLWETKQLSLFFEDFYCSCDLNLLKSDPDFFKVILESLYEKT